MEASSRPNLSPPRAAGSAGATGVKVSTADAAGTSAGERGEVIQGLQSGNTRIIRKRPEAFCDGYASHQGFSMRRPF